LNLIWNPRALMDREKIMEYIAQDNLQAAFDLDELFEKKADQLLNFPELHKPGRIEGTREAVVHPHYVMVYVLEGDAITILRVLHTARNWP